MRRVASVASSVRLSHQLTIAVAHHTRSTYMYMYVCRVESTGTASVYEDSYMPSYIF